MKSTSTKIIQYVKAEWESTIDSVPQLIFVLSKNGKVLRANRTIELWGLGPVELVNGLAVHGLMHPDCTNKNCYLKQLLKLADKVLSTSESVEFRVYDEELSKSVLIQLTPVGGDDLEVFEHVVIIFRDIGQINLADVNDQASFQWNLVENYDTTHTRQVKTDDRLHANQKSNLDFNYLEKIKNEWESAVDSLQQIICLSNEHGSILRVNRGIEHWGLGDVTSALGSDVHELLHKDCNDENCYLHNIKYQIAEVVATGKVAVCQHHDAILNRHLHFQINLFSSNRIPNNDLAVLLITDLSDIRHADCELERLNAKLEKRISAKTLSLQKINLKLKKEIELRKLAEIKFKDSRQKFSHLVELMNEGMVIQDLQQKITYANRHLLKILGMPRSEVVGQPFTKFVAADFIDSWTNGSLKNVRSVETSYVFQMKGAQGRTCWVKGLPQRLIDSDSNVIGSFAVITDINDQIEIEQQLLKTKVKLRSLAKQVLFAQEIERKRIASELHDGIGQTLSAVKFYVENHIRDFIESPSLEMVKRFESVIPKLQAAIEEVRRISMDLRPSLLDDIGILATLIWFCREAKQMAPNINFLFDRANVDEADFIDSLKTEIFRIVQEAVNNAIKYSHAKNITIALNDSGKHLVLEIIDDGMGFDYPQVASQQGYAESKGMGLVSMRERVENSGGAFSLESSLKGSAVICKWPKVQNKFVEHRSGRRDRRKNDR